MLNRNIEMFLNFLAVERGFSLHTVAAYKNDLYDMTNSLFSLCRTSKKSEDWDSFNKKHFQLFVELMIEREYKPSTKSRKIAAVRSFVKFLRMEGIIKDNPVKDIRQPSNHQKIPNALSTEQINRILKYTASDDSKKSIRDNAIIELMYATGIRVSEVVNLNIRDLDLDIGNVKVTGKGSKQRIIPLHELSIVKLKKYINEVRTKLRGDRLEENALFLSNRGKRITRQNLWAQIKNIADKVGITINMSPHTIRHSFATHLLAGGASIRHVQEILGHANLETTQIYTHVDNKQLRNVYNNAHPRAHQY